MQTPFKLRPLGLALLALAGECAHVSAHAQAVSAAAPVNAATSKPMPTAQLDEVVVSGSRSATKLSETPVAIGAVKSEQWDQDKPKTIGEIINRIPGVKWNDLGNEQHSMSIRQPISTNAVYQYLEDGIPIRPLGVFNHNSLNETNMNASGGVEVVKGAASSLYGSNAVGGAINFLTKRPSKTPTGTLGARYDNTDKFSRVDTAASNTWGDLGLLFAHYSSRRDSANWQNYSGGQKDSVSLRADYEISGTSWLRASVIQTDLNAEMTGSLFEADYRNNPSKSINTFTYRKDKATRGNLAWEGETTNGGITTATLFSRTNDHGQLPSYTIGSCVGLNCTGTINNNHVDSLGLDVKHDQKLDWRSAKLVSGVYIDSSKNTYVSDNLAIRRDVEGVYRTYNISAVQLGRRNYSADILNNAVFSQLEFTPVQDVRIVAGGRYDGISYNFKNNLTPGTNYGAPDEVRTFGRFSPKVGATLAVNESNSLYTNVSGGFKPPEVSELYGKSAIPDLRASTYVNLEVGWRAAFGGGVKLDSALYQLDGSDTIVSYTITPGNSENRNAGQTRSRGVELGLSYEEKALDWRVGWSYAQHKFLTYAPSAMLDYSGNEMPQAPRNTINATVGYKVAPGARLALGMVYQGEYWMDNANTVRYPGHALFNLQGGYTVGGGVEAWFQVRNLGDVRYSDSASSSYSGTGVYNPDTQNTYSPGAPRSLMIGITKTFGRRQP
jgi:outer membrane receptor protein involved in Fe transport